MNIGNILKVADAIEQVSVPGLGFNMSCGIESAGHTIWRGPRSDNSGRGCGTVACVAGWTCVVLADRDTSCDQPWVDVRVDAQGLLDLSDVLANALFEPARGLRSSVTDEHAVRCLRNLAITGKVNWEQAMKPADPAMPALPVAAPFTPATHPHRGLKPDRTTINRMLGIADAVAVAAAASYATPGVTLDPNAIQERT